ncbi:MAG: response regulator [Candidatus Liptonbacteria bacterium]|nr:response regulator [Candidatus Liptonbacteria bacterium]
MNPAKIFIVEDERFLSTILANRLKKEGFEVEQAFDGQEAIDMLRTKRPDLIIVDLILPVRSGFEVLESISKNPELSHVPVIALTNLGQETDMEKAKSLGVVDYHIKIRTSVDDFVSIIKSNISKLQDAGTAQNSQ